MRPIAPNVWQLGGFPPNAINVYLIGDVLIDAATRWAGRRVLRQLSDRTLSMLDVEDRPHLLKHFVRERLVPDGSRTNVFGVDEFGLTTTSFLGSLSREP